MHVVKKYFERVKKLLSSSLDYLMAKSKASWRFATSFFIKVVNNTTTSIKRFGRWLLSIATTIIDFIDVPVFKSFIISVLVVRLYSILVAQKTLSLIIQNLLNKNNSDAMQSFIDWIGIPYGLLVSMILVRSWEQLESAGGILEKEAHAIWNLAESVGLDLLPTASDSNYKQTINSLIQTYIKHVDVYYNTEYKDSSQERMTGDRMLADIRREIEAIPNLQELESKLSAVEKSRRDRLLKSKVRMPFSLRVLLYLSSLLWLIPFMWTSFDNIWLSYLLVGSLTFVVFTIISTALTFYEPTSIKQNDISGSWKELKSKINLN